MDSVRDIIVSYCLLLRLNNYHCLIFQRQFLAYVCVLFSFSLKLQYVSQYIHAVVVKYVNDSNKIIKGKKFSPHLLIKYCATIACGGGVNSCHN